MPGKTLDSSSFFIFCLTSLGGLKVEHKRKKSVYTTENLKIGQKKRQILSSPPYKLVAFPSWRVAVLSGS